MPRHTHPPRHAKHERSYLRVQRERYISRRFRRAKRDGTLDHLWLSPSLGHRNAMPLEDYEAERDRIFEQLVALGATVDPALSYFASRLGLHPEILRRLPQGLARETSGSPFRGGGLGALANRDVFWRYCQGCGCCKPYRHEPGYRTRVKAFDRYLIREGVDAWEERNEEGLRGRPSTNRELRFQRGWC